MIGKKYLFESRSRLKRKKYFLFTIVTSGFLFFCYTCFTLYLPFYASKETARLDEYFFKKSPDAIAVFTGDSGRIDYALKLATKYPSAQLFITGVYSKNSLKTLLEKQGSDISVETFLEQEKHHIELDYLARNTFENAHATLNYLKRIQNHKDIIIISSDYHIFRSSMLIGQLNGESLNFYYKGLSVDYTKWPNIKKLLKETFKVIQTRLFLMFWEKGS